MILLRLSATRADRADEGGGSFRQHTTDEDDGIAAIGVRDAMAPLAAAGERG